MPTAFITGASGFLGGHLARRLCSLGYSVRALVRPTSCLDALNSLPLDLVRGDLSNAALIHEATRNCDIIFHAAADYRLWTRNPAEMYASNVEGTRHIMQAAWDHDIPKVVYTSTVGTIELSGRTASDETSFLRVGAQTGHYKKSKFMAEQETLAFAKRGLPVVIVNPSAPVGSHDWKPTPTGRIVLDFLNGRMPMYLDTGLNLVDVEDVAEAHLLAAKRGRDGERYILGHENLQLREILEMLSEMTGIPSPRIRCPYSVALTAAWFSEGWASLTGAAEPRVPREGVYMARKYMFYDCRKARQELGFKPAPAQTALRKAVHWFIENGYVTRRLPAPFLLPKPEPGPIVHTPAVMEVNHDAVAVGK